MLKIGDRVESNHILSKENCYGVVIDILEDTENKESSHIYVIDGLNHGTLLDDLDSILGYNHKFKLLKNKKEDLEGKVYRIFSKNYLKKTVDKNYFIDTIMLNI